jgi:hypothetical protein
MSQRTNGNAHEFAAAERESPRVMRGATYANSRIRYNIDIFGSATGEAILRIGAQIDFVMSTRYVERLRQLTRSGTKSAYFLNAAPFSHELNSTNRLKRPN